MSRSRNNLSLSSNINKTINNHFLLFLIYMSGSRKCELTWKLINCMDILSQ